MKGVVVNWAHLAAVWTLGLALPVLQVLDKSPDYLIAEHAGFPDVPLVTAGFVLAVPTVLAAIGFVVDRANRVVGDWYQAAAIGALAGAFAVQFAKDHADAASRGPQIAGVVFGLAVAAGYLHTRFVPAVLSVLSPAVAIVLVWFLAFSTVAPRAWGETTDSIAQTEANGTPVVLVIFDEFSGLSLLNSRSEIDAARFPGLARLPGTWYRNASTVADATTEAVPAILSGQLKHGFLPIATDHPTNLFTLLQGQYRMHVHEPITHLCTFCDDGSSTDRIDRLRQSLWELTKQRVKRGDPDDFLGIPPETIRGRDRTFRHWMEAVEGGRTLNMLHIELPHTPWWFDPQGHQYTQQIVIPELDNEVWTDDPKCVAGYQARYLDQVEFVDRLVGELRATLERKGIWDQALVVLVADHGVAFRPGASRRFVSRENLAQVGSVPLFVKPPGEQKRRVSDELATTVDVFPTIGDWLGTGWKGQGQSLRRPVGRDRVLVSGLNGPKVGASRAEWSLLRTAATRDLAAAR